MEEENLTVVEKLELCRPFEAEEIKYIIFKM
jgi:hypothetical protein